jgi:predicted nucleic acid-binding protein
MKTKTYWDASALVKAATDDEFRKRLAAEGGVTRPHALAETFSALTGGRLTERVDAAAAAEIVAGLSADLDFCDLTAPEVLRALAQAEAKGVRGGRVHDYLHAVAAHKGKAGLLLTADRHGFDRLFDKVELI